MNLNNMTQLSIITINKNDAKGLEKTLESIWKKQSFKDFEHIIIDGASTDNSINIIKSMHHIYLIGYQNLIKGSIMQ